jgi:broad specificity phosphatase PhoE
VQPARVCTVDVSVRQPYRKRELGDRGLSDVLAASKVWSRRRERASLGDMDVFLVRHGESTANASRIWQGQSDTGLSEKGRGEAAKLGERLRGQRYDRVISSDLSRAYDTARLAAPGCEIERDETFREIDLGSWAGLAHDEVSARYPEQMRAMLEGEDIALGGGESMPRFDARARAALERVLSEGAKADRVLIFTHGGVIRAIVMGLLEQKRGRPLIGSVNTGVTHVRGDVNDLLLVSYNCSVHLGEVAQRDERVSGHDMRQRVARHLGLSETAHARLAAHPLESVSYLARQSGSPMLRAYALPARFGP